MRYPRLVNRAAARVRNTDVPVLAQEMRVRARGGRYFPVLFGYVLILSAIAMVCIYASNVTVSNAAQIGKELFLVLSMVQMAMIALVVPAFGAGSVSRERERGTFDLLALTLLPSRDIVVQKLAGALMEALLLVISSLPVVGITFLLGGVSPLDVIWVYAVLILTAGVVGTLSILCSCVLGNTRSSMFASYMATLLLLGGIPISTMILDNLVSVGMYDYMGSEPLVFTLMFAFVGGIHALVVYGILALALRRRTALWHTRAFRMAVFGGTYALLLLVLSTPWLFDPMMGLMGYGSHAFPLPMYVNPFFAVAVVVGGEDMGASMGEMIGVILGTLTFSVASAYLFGRIAAFRFHALRGS